ncbi:hypothetical protein OG21DRAFT_1490457 [Imleria badia]|nr:hypothetical protein OG21DRAFT_1490457 [Imleria badia]
MCHLAAAQVASLIPTISRTPTCRPPGCSLALPPLQHPAHQHALQHPARQRIRHLLARLHSRLYNIAPTNVGRISLLLAYAPASITPTDTLAAPPCSLLTLPPPSCLPTRWPHLLVSPLCTAPTDYVPRHPCSSPYCSFTLPPPQPRADRLLAVPGPPLTLLPLNAALTDFVAVRLRYPTVPDATCHVSHVPRLRSHPPSRPERLRCVLDAAADYLHVLFVSLSLFPCGYTPNAKYNLRHDSGVSITGQHRTTSSHLFPPSNNVMPCTSDASTMSFLM